MSDVLLIGAEELENLGTRSMAAVLRRYGYTAELAAFSHAGEMEAVVRQTQRGRPRIIGLSVIFQYRTAEFMALAERLRRELPGAHITTGGHFPSFSAAELLMDYPALDSVVRGEGEFTLLELLRRLLPGNPANGDPLAGLPGLSYRRNGLVIDNPPRALIRDLDQLPFPVRDTPPAHHFGVGFAPIIGSRGCYRDCSFCSIHAFYQQSRGKIQRFRGIPNLLDEMEELYHRHGVKFFVFNDDEWFPAGPARYRRVEELENGLRQRGMQIIMSIKCRADDVEEDLFRLLLEMGVVRAYVGVESGSERSLKTLGKRTTVLQNIHALEVLNKIGMLADFGLIIFDPYSTLDDIRANIGFLERMGGAGQAPLSFGRMEVYAGTPILRQLQAENRLEGNYLAWRYLIPDERVELLFRLMYTTLQHRHYANEGLGKQSSLAYYELMIFKYLHRRLFEPAVEERLKDIVGRINRHSLAVFSEMLHFVEEQDIYSIELVNRSAMEWAGRINLFDLQVEQELQGWRQDLNQRLERAERNGAGK